VVSVRLPLTLVFLRFNETDPPARTTPPRVMQVVPHAAQVTLEDDCRMARRRTGYITTLHTMVILNAARLRSTLV